MRARAADAAGVRGDRAERQSEPLEYPAVARVHRRVGLVEARLVGVKRVRVLHQEFTAAHDAEARPDLVAELDLDLVEIDR